jgi:hypothetical protein
VKLTVWPGVTVDAPDVGIGVLNEYLNLASPLAKQVDTHPVGTGSVLEKLNVPGSPTCRVVPALLPDGG